MCNWEEPRRKWPFWCLHGECPVHRCNAHACLLRRLNATTHDLIFKVMWIKLIKKMKGSLAVGGSQRESILVTFLLAEKKKSPIKAIWGRKSLVCVTVWEDIVQQGEVRTLVTLLPQLGGRETNAGALLTFVPFSPFLLISGSHLR